MAKEGKLKSGKTYKLAKNPKVAPEEQKSERLKRREAANEAK